MSIEQKITAQLSGIEADVNTFIDNSGAQIREHADRILDLEQGGGRTPPPRPGNNKTISARFKESEEIQKTWLQD